MGNGAIYRANDVVDQAIFILSEAMEPIKNRIAVFRVVTGGQVDIGIYRFAQGRGPKAIVPNGIVGEV